MVFSSVTFLFFFLPTRPDPLLPDPPPLRNTLLLLASLVFYTWGAGSIVLVLSHRSPFNGVFGLGIERAMEAGRRRRAQRSWRSRSSSTSASLAWFKYANFAVETLGGALGALGQAGLPWTAILLPIGISFYTFHALSYLVDIYRGTARHLSNPIDFALYIAFFPQLIAGPIVRFHEIRDQLVRRTETSSQFAAGVYRFCHGLGKKVLIADTVAPIADAAFATPTGELNTPDGRRRGRRLRRAAVLRLQRLHATWRSASPMMFGIHLPENFARPYASRSVTEFWRRWHMSLSRWFRDYLYIPLGGNRGSSLADVPEPDHRVPDRRACGTARPGPSSCGARSTARCS